jgi:hypothetical protein
MIEFFQLIERLTSNIDVLIGLLRANTLPIAIKPLTIKGFCARYPEISENTVRYWIASDQNGFSSVYTKIGRNIYIDDQLFTNWFRDQVVGGSNA